MIRMALSHIIVHIASITVMNKSFLLVTWPRWQPPPWLRWPFCGPPTCRWTRCSSACCASASWHGPFEWSPWPTFCRWAIARNHPSVGLGTPRSCGKDQVYTIIPYQLFEKKRSTPDGHKWYQTNPFIVPRGHHWFPLQAWQFGKVSQVKLLNISQTHIAWWLEGPWWHSGHGFQGNPCSCWWNVTWLFSHGSHGPLCWRPLKSLVPEVLDPARICCSGCWAQHGTTTSRGRGLLND